MMSFRDILICTVGTSLKGNIERNASNEIREHWNRSNFQGISLKLLGYKPEDRILGAEINSIAGIVKQKIISERGRLCLLVSDTPDGDFIGKVLKGYYENRSNPFRFDVVVVQPLLGLSDADPHKFRREGLRNLVREVSRIVRKEGPERIVINATGGYKAQISFAGMIGQALGIPVCYLFERFSEVIELPPQPISLDLSFWLENISLFYELAADEGKSNPAERDARFASLVEVEIVDGEQLIGLSPVGQLFHETFRYRFEGQKAGLLPPASGLDPAEKTVKYEDQNKGKHPGLEHYLERLKGIPYVIRIYTHYYNPRLPLNNYFRPSNRGLEHIEGGYSDGKATTKFDVVTTAKTESQRNSVLGDLMERMKKG